jgi:hypothetical protein
MKSILGTATPEYQQTSTVRSVVLKELGITDTAPAKCSIWVRGDKGSAGGAAICSVEAACMGQPGQLAESQLALLQPEQLPAWHSGQSHPQTAAAFIVAAACMGQPTQSGESHPGLLHLAQSPASHSGQSHPQSAAPVLVFAIPHPRRAAGCIRAVYGLIVLAWLAVGPTVRQSFGGQSSNAGRHVTRISLYFSSDHNGNVPVVRASR